MTAFPSLRNYGMWELVFRMLLTGQTPKDDAVGSMTKTNSEEGRPQKVTIIISTLNNSWFVLPANTARGFTS